MNSVVEYLKGKEKPKPSKQLEGEIWHECPHCGKLTNAPWKEIVYITFPPTEKLICNHCRGVICVLVQGELSIRQNIVQTITLKYDLVVMSTNLLLALKELNEKDLFVSSQVKAADGNHHLTVESTKELSFERLKSENKIISWQKVG